MVSPRRVMGRIVGGAPPITKKKKPEVELPEERIIPPLELPEELEYATALQVDILRRAIEEGTLAQKGITRPLHLTPTQVSEIGFELPEGYLARLEVKAEGAEPMISLITPEGVSEPFPLPTELPEVEVPEIAEEDVATLLEQIRIEGRTPEIEDLMMEFGATEEEIESFFAELIAPEIPKAKPEDIQRILRMGGVPEEEIRKVQELATLDLDSEGWLKKFVEINPSTKKSFAYALFSRSFAAGLGDIIAAGGGVAGWAKQEDMRQNLLGLAGTLQSSAPPQEVWEPSMATILDPRFWQTTVARALPFSLSFIPLALLTATGGSAVAGAVGLGTFGTYLLTVIFGGVGAAVSEATLEAGGTYNEAKARNFTDEQASEAAGSVFQKNILSLTGMNAAQFFVAFLPAPARTLNSLIARGLVRTATVAGRMTVVGLSEAGEEVIQDIWQRQALGEEIVWDDEMKMVAMLGAIMGVGLGGAGEAFTTIQSRTVDALPEDLKSQYDADITAFEAEGLTPGQAQLKALDGIAETEEGKATIDEIIDQIQREETIRLIEPKTEAEALAWEHISKQEEVIPEVVPPAEEVPAVPEGVRILPLEEVSKLETRIPIDLIRKDEAGEIRRLTEEIQREGIKEPITIRIREDGSQIVWDGIHRLIVAQDLGIKNIPVRFIGKEVPAVPEEVRVDLALRRFEEIEEARTAEQKYGVNIKEVTEDEYVKAGLDFYRKEAREIGFELAEDAQERILRDEYEGFTLPEALKPPIAPPVKPPVKRVVPKITDELTDKRADALVTEPRPLVGAEPIPRGTVRHPKFAKGREDVTREINQEVYATFKDDPLGASAAAYLKTGDFAKFIELMPDVGELKLEALGTEVRTRIGELEDLRSYIEVERDLPAFDKLIKELKKGERLTVEDAVFLGIALRTTKGGRILPAIRRSGFFVTTDFAEYPNFSDVGYTSGNWMDTYTLFEAIDGGYATGGAQKSILYPTHIAHMARDQFSDAYKYKVDKLTEQFGLEADLKLRKVTWAVVQEITKEEADFKTAQVLRKPAIQEIISKYDKTTQTRLVEYSQGVRALLDELIANQNLARTKRGQDIIAYREKYLAWVAETNIWSKLGLHKRTPADFFVKPPLPDYIKPDAPFNPRAMAREGGMRGYEMEKDVRKLLKDYVDTAAKDIFNTNIIHNAKIHVAALRSMGYPNSATLIQDRISQGYAGTLSGFERGVRGVVPIAPLRAVWFIRRQLTRAVFPLNWMWNITIQPSSIAFTVSRYGVRNTMRGLSYLFDSETKAYVRERYSWVIKSRRGGKMAYQDIGQQVVGDLRTEGSLLDKAESIGNFLTNTIEEKLTGISIVAARHHGENLGFTGRDLDEFASKGGAKTQSMYNFEDLPGVLQSKTIGSLFPFQTFCFQCFNFTRELVGVRRFRAGAYETISAKSAEGQATIARRLKMAIEFLAVIFVINMAVDEATNRKPWRMSSFIPFYSNLIAGMDASNPWNWPLPVQYVADFWKSFNAVIKYDDWTKLRKWLIRYHMLGGTQINKMLDGTIALIHGEVTDARGKRLFEVKPEEWLRVIFMGPYASEQGREYIDRLRERRGDWYEYTGIPLPSRIDINDEIDKNLEMLGETDEEGAPYDFGDFVSDLREIRRAVGEKRFDISVSPFIDGLKKAEASREEIEGLPPKKLKDMSEDDIADLIFPEADPEDAEITALWTDFNTLETKGQRRVFIAEYIQQHSEELKDNMVARYYNLLEDMELLTGKDLAAFLEGHPELTKDWRSEWRRDNPEDDARLAMWGYGGKIQTPEAFDLIRKWSEELGIDLDHLPTWLPPKGSEENYFEFIREMTERSWNSWEAQLILARDDVLREALGYDEIEAPIASLELKVKHRELSDTISGYRDKDSPLYIEDDEERAEAVKKLKVDNPDWVDDMRRIEAIEKGTNENPTPDDIVRAWVGRGREVDEFEAGSSEVKVWCADNMDAYRWALDNELLTDDGGLPDDDPRILERGRVSDKWNIPSLRINKKWRGLLDEKAAWSDPTSDTFIAADATMLDPETSKIVDKREWTYEKQYADNPEYHDDIRRQDVYNWYGADMVADPDVVESHIIYMREVVDMYGGTGSHAFLWRYKNDKYNSFRTNVEIFGENALELLELDKLPIWQIDVDYAKEDAEYQAILDKYAGTEQTTRINTYLYDAQGNPTEYCLKKYERNALKIEFPAKRIKDYVSWYTDPKLKKPDDWKKKTGTDLWYEDDWFLMEHQKFYQAMRDKGIFKERRDFRTPEQGGTMATREVFEFYLGYLKESKGKRRDDYRYRLWVKRTTLPFTEWRKRDMPTYEGLEEWLLATDRVSVHIKEKKIREELTAAEIQREETWRRELEIEEKLEEIEEKLKR